MRSAKYLIETGRRAKLRFDPRKSSYRQPNWKTGAQSCRVAVVGAGVSGLATAIILRELGHSVRIFEARDKPGGRIRTLPHPSKKKDVCVELGAARIADTHEHTLFWIRKLGLRVEPMYPASGHLVRLEHGRRLVGAELSDLSAHETHGLITGHTIWGSQFKDARSAIRTLVRDGLTKSNWYRIVGGNVELPNTMAEAVGQSLLYGAAVRAVDQTGPNVRVKYTSNGTDYAEEFDRIVLAVPHGRQTDIAFDPPLSPRKQAHASAGHQSALRVFVEFKDMSWLSTGICGYGCTSDGEEIWCPTHNKSRGYNVLVLYAQGESAKAWLPLSRDQRHAKALRTLALMFPSAVQFCVSISSHCWDEDPWARGAQSLVDFDIFGNDLGRVEGRMHFAGEHTSSGWIDGALQSANRVVSEITSTGLKTLRMQATPRVTRA